jgi:galactose oxidase-like protein
MPEAFNAIPDWFSHENQGGGIAVASLTGAQSDVVVLAVDDPPGRNRGVFRVGRALDRRGSVTGDWSAWVDVPDWFSHQNQGADIALADLLGNGRHDLVVAMIDSPPGQNRGLFRVGLALTPDGEVSGGWSPWTEIPDWFSWENQGIAVTVTPPAADGRVDLVVLMVDNGAQANRGVYRVGQRLRPDGSVEAWTEWLDVPDWFSWENAGCGVAVLPPADAAAGAGPDGTYDLAFFMIDNAVGQNQAFYRIAKNVGDDAIAAGGWERWRGVPFWFSWENQGGAIAAARVEGENKLIAFMIDAPAGQNAGGYEVVDLAPDPSEVGQWELLPFRSGVLAVHAALLPHGRVLFFAGSGSSATRFASPLFGDEDEGVFTSVVWTPPDNSFEHPATLRTVNGKPFDFFCGGDAFLPDGKMLSAGGTLAYNPFKGRNDATIFDPGTGEWSFAAPMQHGRWYPTLISLGDGRILATTGLTENGNAHNATAEIYNPALNNWQTRVSLPGFPGLPLYAHLFLLADGRVFFSGGRMDDPLAVQPCILDLTTNPVTAEPVPDLLEPDVRNQSASVLLPPAQDQRVMIIGGGPVGKADKTDATDAVSIVDLSVDDPHYLPAAPLGLPRLHLNAVLLPDRTVYVGGGSLKQEDQPLARLEAEIYDPATDTWTVMAASGVARLYHSTALLLPDGRVVAAGGNPEGGHSVTWEPPDPEEEMQLEIFSPPYLFKGPRPQLSSAPTSAGYQDTITIGTADPARIRWVSLIKNGVTTHSFDSGQRLVDLPITARGAGTLDVSIPDNPNLAPPGWYMLFLVDDEGVPSVAGWIQLT